MMPPSFYCKPRWIKAGGRSTGHSLAPSTQIQFMNNQSKKCLSEQHCPCGGVFHERAGGWHPIRRKRNRLDHILDINPFPILNEAVKVS
ncbi:hypothetical protein, partial [Aeromonas caviae]|uniref:hypothetical protein n=1 Tax=Aeromonas caviae TaxID=648 RepID=UPI001C1F8C62